MGDKAAWARDHGAEAIELTVAPRDQLHATADEINGVLPICSICGNCDAQGNNAYHFLHPDPAKRFMSLDASRTILEFCGQVGAVGQIIPPIFGPPVVPDLSPVMSPIEIEDLLMVSALKQLGPFAAEHGTLLLLEPLNRYEQHYLKKQSDGVRVIEQANVKGAALLADLFHMHIEETDMPQAIVDAGKHVAAVHLADNTRDEPGTGDIDFCASFAALKKIGFDGYMAYECNVRGGADDAQQRANLAQSLELMRRYIADA